MYCSVPSTMPASLGLGASVAATDTSPGATAADARFASPKSRSFTSIVARLLLRADESVPARAPTSMTLAGFKSR